MTIKVISSDPTTGHNSNLLRDIKRRLFNDHYIHFYEKNKWTIIFISAQVNNLSYQIFQSKSVKLTQIFLHQFCAWHLCHLYLGDFTTR